MPTHVEWDNSEQHQVIVELLPPLTWGEFHASVCEAHEMIAAVDHRVDIIMWARTLLPAGLALPKFRTAFHARPNNTGTLFIVPTDKPVMVIFFKQLANILDHALGMKNRVVFSGNLEEARRGLPEVSNARHR